MFFVNSFWRNETDTGILQVIGYNHTGHVVCIDPSAFDPEPYSVPIYHFETAMRYDAWIKDGHIVYRAMQEGGKP
jgi:hypothetical protein